MVTQTLFDARFSMLYSAWAVGGVAPAQGIRVGLGCVGGSPSTSREREQGPPVLSL